ncbi:hypothetical protein [Streptomyces sp. NPDC059802]|uniref:hypothetical protein n=1 Tax=Streptomyces sp. NPDC059802 TaxID=3346952 RepID=UPI00365099C7
MSRESLQAAAEKADAIVLDTLSSVQPTLDWVHDVSSESGCDSYTISGRETGAVTRRAAVMTIVSEARRGSLLGVIERAWKKSGYTITSVDRDKAMPAIYARSPAGFRMSLSVGYKGRFHVSVTTPCFIMAQVRPPQTQANGRTFTGDLVPAPNVHSDFWSAGAL